MSTDQDAKSLKRKDREDKAENDHSTKKKRKQKSEQSADASNESTSVALDVAEKEPKIKKKSKKIKSKEEPADVKMEDAATINPEQTEPTNGAVAVDEATTSINTDEKPKVKKSKKRKSEAQEVEQLAGSAEPAMPVAVIGRATDDATNTILDHPTDQPAAKKGKKSKDSTKSAPEESTDATPTPKRSKKTKDTKPDDITPVEGTEGVSTDKPAEEAAASSVKNSKFITFIGNLPYTTTVATLTAHFASLQPFTLRLSSDKISSSSQSWPKQPQRSCRGFAFIEFDNYDRMKTALKLMHHSEFNDGISKPRKINVELTAGGGGGGKERMEKVREKNERLEGQRTRRKEEEEKQRVRKEAKEAKKAKGEAKKEGKELEKGVPKVEAPKVDDQAGIHPSRRAQVAH